MAPENQNQELELENLIKELIDTRQKIEHYTEHKKLLETQYAQTLGPGRHTTGPYQCNTTYRATLDTDKLAQDYPPQTYPHLYKHAIDTAAARKYFAPQTLTDTYTKTSTTPTVTIR